MAYNKKNWQDNVSDITAVELNRMEQGIYDNSLVVDAVTNTLNPTDTETYKTAELTEGQITDVIGVSDILIKGDTDQDGTPTPSAPVDVNVVSGSNVINTSNKNLLSINNGTFISVYNFNGNVQNGIITVNGTPSSTPGLLRITLSQPIKLKQNDSVKINVNNSNGIGTSSNYVAFRLVGIVNGVSNDNITEVMCTSANANKTFTATNNTIINQVIVRGNANVTFNNFIIKPQIELGTTATTYESHQGKELSLDLGSIELCKIGDYQDYFYKSGNKWYLHKEIGKITLNGSESGGWTLRETNTNTIRITADGLVSPGILAYSQVYSKVFKGYSSNADMSNIDIPSIAPRDTGSGFTVRFPVSIATTVDGFKAWLSSNLPFVYYATSNITNTEITDTTLISQLEAIYNAPLYEQTNITQENNDLPIVLDITACKDNINGIKAFIRK